MTCDACWGCISAEASHWCCVTSSSKLLCVLCCNIIPQRIEHTLQHLGDAISYYCHVSCCSCCTDLKCRADCTRFTSIDVLVGCAVLRCVVLCCVVLCCVLPYQLWTPKHIWSAQDAAAHAAQCRHLTRYNALLASYSHTTRIAILATHMEYTGCRTVAMGRKQYMLPAIGSLLK